MTMDTHRLARKTDGLIRRIVRRELPGLDITDVEASIGEDHDGDEAIMVEIIHASPEPEVDPKRIAGLMMTMNKELYDSGERRFAYVYNRPSQGQPSFGLR